MEDTRMARWKSPLVFGILTPASTFLQSQHSQARSTEMTWQRERGRREIGPSVEEGRR